MSCTLSLARCLARTHSAPPSLLSAGSRVAHAEVARDAVELVGRDVEPVRPGILDQQVLALDALGGELDQPLEAPDAMILMHDEIAGTHLGQEGARRLRAALLATSLGPAEDLGVGEDGQRQQAAVPALRERPMHDGKRADAWGVGQVSGGRDE